MCGSLYKGCTLLRNPSCRRCLRFTGGISTWFCRTRQACRIYLQSVLESVSSNIDILYSKSAMCGWCSSIANWRSALLKSIRRCLLHEAEEPVCTKPRVGLGFASRSNEVCTTSAKNYWNHYGIEKTANRFWILFKACACMSRGDFID